MRWNCGSGLPSLVAVSPDDLLTWLCVTGEGGMEMEGLLPTRLPAGLEPLLPVLIFSASAVLRVPFGVDAASGFETDV